MKIAFMLWSPAISGGTNVIFEHSLGLQRDGHQVTIVTEEPVVEADVHWFPSAWQLRWQTVADADREHFDLVIATWWRTALGVHRVSADAYLYFVQSIESWFFGEEELPLRALIDSTYTFPFHFVTEASWIQRLLAERYSVDARLVRNGVNKAAFQASQTPVVPRCEGKLRVLVEGTLGVWFKNVEKAIELVRQSSADEVWLLTPSEIAEYPGVDRVFSRVPIAATPAIYGSCDVLVKLSTVEGMFGPPLEMFHCGGTAICYDVTGYDEYIAHEENALVIFSRADADVISAIDRLKQDRDMLKSLSENAKRTADQWPSWHDSAKVFESALLGIRATNARDPSDVRRSIRQLSEMSWRNYKIGEEYRLELLRERSPSPTADTRRLLSQSWRRVVLGLNRRLERFARSS